MRTTPEAKKLFVVDLGADTRDLEPNAKFPEGATAEYRSVAVSYTARNIRFEEAFEIGLLVGEDIPSPLPGHPDAVKSDCHLISVTPIFRNVLE